MATSVPTTFDRALHRNLDEIVRAILAYRALVAIESATSERPLDFVQLAYWALFNDMLAHAMRVLDHHPDTASFWNLYKWEKSLIDRIIIDNGIDIDRLRSISASLRLVRNKTHFHIDRETVSDPKLVWRKAELKGPVLKEVLDDLFFILHALYQQKFECEFWLPDYDGSDAKEIIQIAREKGIIFDG